MIIKIKGRNEVALNQNIAAVMNLALVAFNRGYIPNDAQRKEPKKNGLYWYENQEEGKFEILPVANNHKAFILERGDYFIVIRFHSRYDSDKKEVKALCNLITTFFPSDEIEEVIL